MTYVITRVTFEKRHHGMSRKKGMANPFDSAMRDKYYHYYNYNIAILLIYA